MDWRDILKETVGVTDEKNIVDLTDMEERELLGKEHLDYIIDERRAILALAITGYDHHVL